MSLDYLVTALRLARTHDFLLVMDECYTDIWRGSPPPGMMEAAAVLAKKDGANISHDPLAKYGGVELIVKTVGSSRAAGRIYGG